jgi:hypothetical protein
MKTYVHSWQYLAEFFSEWVIFQQVVEDYKTHILISVTSSENLAIYEIRWKNKVESSRPKMTVWCVHLAFWVIKVTNAQSEYVILIAFPWQQWLPKYAPVLPYM